MTDLWQEPFTMGTASEGPRDPTTDVPRGERRTYPPPVLTMSWDDALATTPSAPAVEDVAKLRREIEELRSEVKRLQSRVPPAPVPVAILRLRPIPLFAGGSVQAAGRVVEVTREGVRLEDLRVQVAFETAPKDPPVIGEVVSFTLDTPVSAQATKPDADVDPFIDPGKTRQR